MTLWMDLAFLIIPVSIVIGIGMWLAREDREEDWR